MLRCGARTGLGPPLQGACGGTGTSQAVAAFVALARALSGAHLVPLAAAAGSGAAQRLDRPRCYSQAAAAEADVAAVYSPTSSSSAPLAFAQAPNGTADPSAAASSAAVAPAAHSAADAPAAAASSAGAAPAAAAASQAQRTAVAGLAEAVTSAGMSLAAALMQKQHRGKPPGIAELAVEILETLRRGGVDETDLASLLSNPQVLREQRRVRRVMPQLELIFGREGAAEVAIKRPALLGSSPETVLRALAAMAVCGVQAPLALARRSPILLQYCHDSPSLVTTRLALQHYLGLSAAEVYRSYPTYLLPSPRTLACRLQYLADLGRLHFLVRSRSAALRQWRQQAAAEAAAAAATTPAAGQAAPKRRGRPRREQQAAAAAAAGAAAPDTGQQQWGAGGPQGPLGSRSAGAPPFLTLSHVVKQSVESFCRFAQLDEADFKAFDSGFSSHPAWLALQQRGQAEAAHLARLLDELQSAAAAAQEEPAGRAPQ